MSRDERFHRSIVWFCWGVLAVISVPLLIALMLRRHDGMDVLGQNHFVVACGLRIVHRATARHCYGRSGLRPPAYGQPVVRKNNQRVIDFAGA